MRMEHITLCCTAGYLVGFPFDWPDPSPHVTDDCRDKHYNAPKKLDEYFSGAEWKGRAPGRSWIAYIPMTSRWRRIRAYLEEHGWTCIQQYMSDEKHTEKGERYMVGIYFQDSKANIEAKAAASATNTEAPK